MTVAQAVVTLETTDRLNFKAEIPYDSDGCADLPDDLFVKMILECVVDSLEEALTQIEAKEAEQET